jgi:hypothetical protein
VLSIKVRGWRLVIIPGDHEPRHVHARYGAAGAAQAVFRLNDDATVTLRGANLKLTRKQIRETEVLIAEHMTELKELWEDIADEHSETTPAAQRRRH